MLLSLIASPTSGRVEDISAIGKKKPATVCIQMHRTGQKARRVNRLFVQFPWAGKSWSQLLLASSMADTHF
jgi:hypothetical protein